MARRRKKHPKFKVGSRVSVRVIREKDGRLYWRAESYDSITQSRTTVWTGWGEREEVERIITRLVADMPDLGVGGRSLTKVRTVLDLMETWVGVHGIYMAVGRKPNPVRAQVAGRAPRPVQARTGPGLDWSRPGPVRAWAQSRDGITSHT